MNTKVMQLTELAIGYKTRRGPAKGVLSSISLELERGELVCLIGPNGAGKSTLLRSISGLQPLLGGSVEVFGDDIHGLTEMERAKKISVVLTEQIDAGMISVFSLVSLGRYPYTPFSGRLAEADVAAVHKALDDVGASELTERMVNTLSDGERQKVMIARALAQDTEVIILDEPTAFLDLPRRTEVLGLLKRLSRETGKTILLSTHDLHLALRNADRLWLIGEDRVIHAGAPEDLVIDQRLERAFAGKNIEFDRYHGSFTNTVESGGRAGLAGSGLHAVWTERALVRAGYEVVDINKGKDAEGLAYTVMVNSSEGEAYSCTLCRNDESAEFDSIGRLTSKIRSIGHG